MSNWNHSINGEKTIETEPAYAVELKEGQSLGENKNYRLEKNLGAGGMGEVWLATEIRDGKEIRKVVVKTIRPDRRENEGAQAKALKQFQLIQKLNHQNICPIYVIEKDPACGYLIVMGYADGGSYADWFEKRPKPLAEVCAALRPIADALDHVHQIGIIHRDVKPENMMFTRIKDVQTSWLIDFGIAASLRTETQATESQFGSSGTDRYMAPEQKNGQIQTERTDEYSLAMVALEFLTGALSPTSLFELSPDLQPILAKALATEPSKRYATCREFIDALAGMPLPTSSEQNDGGSSSAAVPIAKTAIDQIVEAEEEALKKRIRALDEMVAEEYQTGRYEDAVAHLNELLQLKPDHQNAKWLLNSSTQKLEIQKKEEEKREDRVRQAGTRKVLTADGIEYAFRWCPPGEFMMGGPRSEYNGINWVEKSDQCRVILTRGFWMLETQVTQAMWQSVMGENPSWFKGEWKPVENVSWDDCQKFCVKLSQKLGQRVKLPTEAQWEYACRAGTTGDYAGDLNSMAWYFLFSDFTTHQVGLKNPNQWGLYDMHGNVWEWCSDYYDKEYYEMSPMYDPENTTASPSHVMRGGGWDSDPGVCRSASRCGGTPDYHCNYLGLRVLLVPDSEE